MSRRQKIIEESGHNVPAYIVTFSDMTTLLLTFFVMLLSLAQVQDPELIGKGRESFVRAVRGFGLGMLSGRSPGPDFGYFKVKYFIDSPDRFFEGRTIDAREEEIRRVFRRISRSVNTMPSQIVAEKTIFSVTDIHFSPGDAALGKGARGFLEGFCVDLQQDLDSRTAKLYVLGLAADEQGEKQQWILSAKRAQAVADFLKSPSLLGPQWPVYSWGAGPGGDWITQDSPVSKQSQILIAVLKAKD